MEKESNNNEISITWRGKKYVLSMNSDSTLEELGHKLQKLTAVKSDTLKLIVQSHKSSKLLSPFSDEHSHLTLQQTSITEGKPIRMMGVPKEEIDQILKNEKLNMRIAGFDEEEKRIRQMSNGFDTPLKLPTGNYVFGDFRTLDLPGIELNPPASEALRLMHTLAADKGIVAIMNKHKWRVGIMTEMAPEGYVGVSPLCLLGLNKNHGEEISLRLRTDDLKGFRKYQSIKKTLLHELAHMVFSEHDAKFYALDSQLNKEANALDWTRSTGHILNGSQKSQHYEPEFHVTNNNTSLGHKLGGTRNQKPDSLANARASSVAAAYKRLIIPSTPESHKKPDPDNQNEPDPDDSVANEPMETDPSGELARNGSGSEQEVKSERNEPDPDDDIENGPMETGPYGELARKGIIFEENEVKEERNEPDPDDDIKNGPMETDPCGELAKNGSGKETKSERNGQDPDADIENGPMETDPYGELARSVIFEENETDKVRNEPDPDESIKNGPMETGMYGELARKGIIFEENEVKEERNEILNNDEELQRIQDPVVIACNRLNESIRRLQSEVNHSDAVRVFQTLVKIIKNVIQHPDEIKFKKLRKANPVIQKNIASYKGAMEILFLIGFCEDVVHDEIGRAEAYLVLKRNDPGLLWLAKSSLETVV